MTSQYKVKRSEYYTVRVSYLLFFNIQHCILFVKARELECMSAIWTRRICNCGMSVIPSTTFSVIWLLFCHSLSKCCFTSPVPCRSSTMRVLGWHLYKICLHLDKGCIIFQLLLKVLHPSLFQRTYGSLCPIVMDVIEWVEEIFLIMIWAWHLI